MIIKASLFTAHELLAFGWDVHNAKTPTGQALRQEIYNELDARYEAILKDAKRPEWDDASSKYEFYQIALMENGIV
jgi:hypothetical protein